MNIITDISIKDGNFCLGFGFLLVGFIPLPPSTFNLFPELKKKGSLETNMISIFLPVLF